MSSRNEVFSTPANVNRYLRRISTNNRFDERTQRLAREFQNMNSQPDYALQLAAAQEAFRMLQAQGHAGIVITEYGITIDRFLNSYYYYYDERNRAIRRYGDRLFNLNKKFLSLWEECRERRRKAEIKRKQEIQRIRREARRRAEAARKAELARRKAELEARRRAQEAEAKRKAEEARRRAEEARRQAEEAARRLAEIQRMTEEVRAQINSSPHMLKTLKLVAEKMNSNGYAISNPEVLSTEPAVALTQGVEIIAKNDKGDEKRVSLYLPGGKTKSEVHLADDPLGRKCRTESLELAKEVAEVISSVSAACLLPINSRVGASIPTGRQEPRGGEPLPLTNHRIDPEEHKS